MSQRVPHTLRRGTLAACACYLDRSGVHEQKVIGFAESAAMWKLANGDTPASGDIRLAAILHDPPSGDQQPVDVLPCLVLRFPASGEAG